MPKENALGRMLYIRIHTNLIFFDAGSNWYLDAKASDSSEFVSAPTNGWGAAWTYGIVSLQKDKPHIH